MPATAVISQEAPIGCIRICNKSRSKKYKEIVDSKRDGTATARGYGETAKGL